MANISKIALLKEVFSQGTDVRNASCLSPEHREPRAANSDQDENIFEQWLFADTPDRILVDRQGKVLWCRILSDVLELSNENVTPLHKMRVDCFLPSELLVPILNAGNLAQTGQSRIALIERDCARDNIVARVTPLGQSLTGPLGVTISSRQRFSDETRADLKRLWDLSLGESRVLALTFQGFTVQEVSESTALSIETVRTHIRHIYTKVGVNSREALFATIGPVLA